MCSLGNTDHFGNWTLQSVFFSWRANPCPTDRSAVVDDGLVGQRAPGAPVKSFNWSFFYHLLPGVIILKKHYYMLNQCQIKKTLIYIPIGIQIHLVIDNPY